MGRKNSPLPWDKPLAEPASVRAAICLSQLGLEESKDWREEHRIKTRSGQYNRQSLEPQVPAQRVYGKKKKRTEWMKQKLQEREDTKWIRCNAGLYKCVWTEREEVEEQCTLWELPQKPKAIAAESRVVQIYPTLTISFIKKHVLRSSEAVCLSNTNKWTWILRANLAFGVMQCLKCVAINAFFGCANYFNHILDFTWVKEEKLIWVTFLSITCTSTALL